MGSTHAGGIDLTHGPEDDSGCILVAEVHYGNKGRVVALSGCGFPAVVGADDGVECRTATLRRDKYGITGR